MYMQIAIGLLTLFEAIYFHLVKSSLVFRFLVKYPHHKKCMFVTKYLLIFIFTSAFFLKVLPSIAMVETYVRLLLITPHSLFYLHFTVSSYVLLWWTILMMQ